MGVNVEYQKNRMAQERGYSNYETAHDAVRQEIDVEVQKLVDQHKEIQL